MDEIISKAIDRGVTLGAWDMAKRISIIIELSKAGDDITLDDIKMLCDDAIAEYKALK